MNKYRVWQKINGVKRSMLETEAETIGSAISNYINQITKTYGSCEVQYKYIEAELINGTDLDKFIELYLSFGIDLRDQVVKGAENKIWIYPHECYGKIIGSEKIEGYIGFYTSVRFDKAGKFISQKCAE
jgi:hypothetical protein